MKLLFIDKGNWMRNELGLEGLNLDLLVVLGIYYMLKQGLSFVNVHSWYFYIELSFSLSFCYIELHINLNKVSSFILKLVALFLLLIFKSYVITTSFRISNLHFFSLETLLIISSMSQYLTKVVLGYP